MINKYLIIIIITLILILIIFFKFINESTFMLNKEMEPCYYRLGDMYYHSNERYKQGGKYCHYIKYPNSIAVKYMKNTENYIFKSNNIGELLSIVDSDDYANYDKPTKDSLVIHLRVGDIIDNTDNSVDDFLNKNIKYYHSANHKQQYVYNRKYYENIISQLPNNINNVIFVYGYHIDGNHRKSEKYVKAVSDIFKSSGFNIHYRRNMDPDKDVIYMCNSTHFVKSGGGFSRLVSDIVRKKGNIVYY